MTRLLILAAAIAVTGCAHNPAVIYNTATQIQALTKPGYVAAELRTRSHYAR
jgi:uncharacterized lipoprotein YajG